MCFAAAPEFPHSDDDFEDDDEVENEEDEVERAQVRFECMETYRAKWLLDNCESITDMIDRLRQEADQLVTKRNEGWKLEDVILDDYGYLVPPDLEERVATAMRDRARNNSSVSST